MWRSPSRLWDVTVTGIKHSRVMAETFPEGTDAVGSLGFVGLIQHICADRHVTTARWPF